jgi:integral membrane sensor domain MASE1
MPQNPTQKIRGRTRADLALPRLGAIGLAFAVGIAYFLAAQLSLALLAEPAGVAVFWPAAGLSSGVLVVLERDARLPVAIGVAVATIVANLMGDRNVWSAIAFAFCNAGEALLAAWLIERCFASPFDLDRLRNVLGLLAAAVVATATSGIGGTAAYKLFHSPTAPMWTTWQHWFASDIGAATILTITWRELGGPPIPAPVRGYGLSLIRDLIPHELGGNVDLVFPSDGACCKIEIPLGQR